MILGESGNRLGSKVVECSNCGMQHFVSLKMIRFMHLHEQECNGYTEASEKFQKGDRVHLSRYGQAYLGREDRTGEVVRLNSADERSVVVKWDGRTTVSYINFRFIEQEEVN